MRIIISFGGFYTKVGEFNYLHCNFIGIYRIGEQDMNNEPDKNDQYIDNLTGTYTMEYLEKQLAIETREGTSLASLALIDVSWIKQINESLGYSTGNAALKEFIQKLKENLQERDEIYRLSGLEFAILLPGQNSEHCIEKLQNIKNNLGTLKILHKDTEVALKTYFTIGIVMLDFEINLPLVSLLELARQALALARCNGQGIAAYKDSLKKKILLVEDTDFIVNYVNSKLKTMNLEVLIAKDGEEGVRKAQIERPDLMIVDLMMPKMDGFEVCRQIKANPKTMDTKIIIMSSRKSTEDVLRCYNLGIDDYLVKPFALDDFEQRINRFLK